MPAKNETRFYLTPRTIASKMLNTSKISKIPFALRRPKGRLEGSLRAGLSTRIKQNAKLNIVKIASRISPNQAFTYTAARKNPSRRAIALLRASGQKNILSFCGSGKKASRSNISSAFILPLLLTVLFITLLCTVAANAHPANFTPLDKLMAHGITDGVFPGAVMLISYQGEIVYHKAWGHYTYDQDSPTVTIDTLFDLASITKVIATTTAAMLLCDAQLLSPEDPVGKYLPGFASGKKQSICIKHLLTHTSGLTDDSKYTIVIDRAETDRQIDASIPTDPPGEAYAYRDVNMLVLQRIIEQITHKPLAVFVAENITGPLGMRDTMFNPQDRALCAPTECNVPGRETVIQGQVHDPQAFALHGVAGNAGLFSTAKDLAIYLTMILADGRDAHGNQFISPETVISWRQRQCKFNRGYGWEIGRHLSPDAFGHFGWTGTSLWTDAERKLFCILLTNRVYPTQENFKIRNSRVTFHDCVVGIVESPTPNKIN